MKKKLLKVISMVLVAGALSLSVVGCGKTSSTGSSQLDKIKQSGKLVLATGDYRPFEYHDEKTNEVVGYDIDLAKKIADELGVKLEVKDMDFTSIIPSVQNGQADLAIAAMYITDERKQAVDFADPYMATGQVLCVKKGSPIKSKDDLTGKKVGAKLGATSAATVQKLIDAGQNIQLVTYKQNEDMLADLENGRIDAGVNDLLYQLQYNATHQNLTILDGTLAQADLGVAVQKGNSDLTDVVNKVIKDMKDSGEDKKLYEKWIPKNN